MRGASASDGGGGGEKPDAADLSDVTHIVTMFGELMNLALDVLHFGLKLNDFVEHHAEGGSERAGELTVAEYCSCLTFGVGSPLGDGIAELTQESTKTIDTLVSGGLELFADTVKLLELLLFDRANWHRLDAFASVSFKQSLGVDAVRLVASRVGFDVLSGDDFRIMTGGARLSGPVVGGATGLEQDGSGFMLSEELGELGPREAMAGDDSVVTVGDRDLEDVLCEIDGDDLRCRLHIGLLLLGHSVKRNRMLAQCDAGKEREESISTLECERYAHRTASLLRRAAAAQLCR